MFCAQLGYSLWQTSVDQLVQYGRIAHLLCDGVLFNGLYVWAKVS